MLIEGHESEAVDDVEAEGISKTVTQEASEEKAIEEDQSKGTENVVADNVNVSESETHDTVEDFDEKFREEES